MKEFLEFIAKNLVDKPEAVSVKEIIEDENRIKFILEVDDAETGKIIGKTGKTAKSIRTLLSAVAAKQGKRVTMEIPDKKNKETQ
ncbi:MAG TPA: KH domain-containing protein [Ignavibacteria bacterium]|nr:KH domain-containing protein [Ignavibacteria bacterium]